VIKKDGSLFLLRALISAYKSAGLDRRKKSDQRFIRHAFFNGFAEKRWPIRR
jgi:hypothetical protein